MFVKIARSACLLGTAAASLLFANASAEALTCPKCYCQPRLCNWATYGYYPTDWRPWPQPLVHDAVPHSPPLPSLPTVNPTAPPPVFPYRMSPTKPGDLRGGAEELKMPLPVKPK